METVEDPIAEYIVEFLAGFWTIDPPIFQKVALADDDVEEDDEDSDYYDYADFESVSLSSDRIPDSIEPFWTEMTVRSIAEHTTISDSESDLQYQELSPSSGSPSPSPSDDDTVLIDPPDCITITVPQLIEKMRAAFMFKLHRLRDYRDIFISVLLDNGLGIFQFQNNDVVDIPEIPEEEQCQTTDQFYLANLMKNLLAFEGIAMNLWSLGDECAVCATFLKFKRGIETVKDRQGVGQMNILSRAVRQGVFKSFFHIHHVKYELDHSDVSPTYRFIICFHKLICSMDFADECAGKLLDHFNDVIHTENKFKFPKNNACGSALP